jgi:hypothetical protein
MHPRFALFIWHKYCQVLIGKPLQPVESCYVIMRSRTTWATFLIFLLLAPTSFAHILNMTNLNLSIPPEGAAKLDLIIDLGQSGLVTPEFYWSATQATDNSKQKLILQEALAKLEEGLVLKVNGQQQRFALTDLRLEAVSLDAIKNPLTPQMARISYALPSVKFSSEDIVELKLDSSIDVPWPCLVRIDAFATLPGSRLLTEETRSSGAILLGLPSQREDSDFLLALTLQFQSASPALSWLAVGFQHVLPDGADHIAFILGLFFLSSRLTMLIGQVTLFTLAHSITLTAAIYGWVSAPTNLIEILIAASIVYVAVDNLYQEQLRRWRALAVLGFGLLHGLGFASALGSLELPQDTTLSALLFFNVGVEVGQLAVLLMAFACVGWFRQQPFYKKRIADPASVTIAGVGLYWFTKRLAIYLF